jgi:hypothetical protein
MIKVKETFLILVLFFGVGCQLCKDMTDFSDCEFRDLSYDAKSLYTLDRSVSFSWQETLNRRFMNGDIDAAEYNEWMVQRYNLPYRRHGDAHFYLDKFGNIKPVPARNTVEWLWYERNFGNGIQR